MPSQKPSRFDKPSLLPDEDIQRAIDSFKVNFNGGKVGGFGYTDAGPNPYYGLPKSVRVGGFDFEVEVSEVGDAQAGMEHGHTNLLSQKIRLSPHQNAQNLANTFIHECLHAIHWVYGLFDGEPDEEQYTTQSANGLCQFMQDNPEAMAWFNKNNKRAAK